MLRRSSTATKLKFRLTDEQAGPFPVASESLWCDQEGSLYRVKNIPFFIDNISFDDLVSISKDANGICEVVEVVSKSANSTVWIYLRESSLGTVLIDELVSGGCGVESGAIDNYYALNIPADLDFSKIYGRIEAEVRRGVF